MVRFPSLTPKKFFDRKILTLQGMPR